MAEKPFNLEEYLELTAAEVEKGEKKDKLLGGKQILELSNEELRQVLDEAESLKNLFFRQAELKKILADIKNPETAKYKEHKKNIATDEMIEGLLENESLLDDENFLHNLEIAYSREAKMSIGEYGRSQEKEYQKELESIEKQIENLEQKPEIITVYRAEFEKRIGSILETDKIQGLEKMSDDADKKIGKIIAFASSQKRETLTEGEKRLIENHERAQKIFRNKIEEKLQNTELLKEYETRKLMEYKYQLDKYGFIETPSVKRDVKMILAHIELDVPVLVHGHLGAGKTEILKYISRRYLGKTALGIGSDPEVFSGHEYANPYDLFGRSQLGKQSEQELDKTYSDNYQNYRKWLESNPKAGASEKRFQRMQAVYESWEKNPANQKLSKDDKNKYKEILENDIIKEGKDVVSFFQYGPMLRALKDGSPVILDEIDAIPKSILFRLNDLLTRRAGQKVRIQENGGEEFEIPKGFCILATANIKGERYTGRTDLDSAFLSRFWSTEYQYLPEEETKDAIKSYLIDRRGGLPINLFPEESPEERKSHSSSEFQSEKNDKILGPIDGTDSIKSLASMTREIQKIFTGEIKKTSNLVGERNKPTTLEKAVLSLRALDHILRAYKESREKNYLEYYIWQEFIKPSATVKKDAIYLVELFCQGGYFKDWRAGDFAVTGLTEQMVETAKGRQNP